MRLTVARSQEWLRYWAAASRLRLIALNSGLSALDSMVFLADLCLPRGFCTKEGWREAYGRAQPRVAALLVLRAFAVSWASSLRSSIDVAGGGC